MNECLSTITHVTPGGRTLFIRTSENTPNSPIPVPPEVPDNFRRICTHYDASLVGVFALWIDAEIVGRDINQVVH